LQVGQTYKKYVGVSYLGNKERDFIFAYDEKEKDHHPAI
jgi:hypothetical protein